MEPLLHEAGYPEPLVRLLREACQRSLDESKPLDCDELAVQGIDLEAATSMRGQLLSRRIRKDNARVRHEMARYAEVWQNGREGDDAADVLVLAQKARYPPYLFCRLLLEAVLECPKSKVGELVKRPAGIADARLRGALRRCLAADGDCSPASDLARRVVGAEYEFLLQQRLAARSIPFECEDELRSQGLAKTPDVRLALPLGVKDPRSGQWVEVRWIDSKAMFGDARTWQHEHAPQLEGYLHRYGPGLVIYWFGFETALPRCEGVVVTASFPSLLLFPGAQEPSELPL